jgi:hypothetical protein
MKIYKEIKFLAPKLNEYQRNFTNTIEDLFTKIPKNNIGLNSYVRFDPGSNILEISLIHNKDPEMMLLFIIHEDMVEIGCLEYSYYLDSMKNAILFGLQGKEFYSNVYKVVNSMLNATFKQIIYSYKGKNIKSEIVWKDHEIPNQKRNYSFFSFLYVKELLEKQEITFKSFMD